MHLTRMLLASRRACGSGGLRMGCHVDARFRGDTSGRPQAADRQQETSQCTQSGLTLRTSKPLWWTLSVLIFMGFWFLPTGGKYQGHVLAWFWLAVFTGEISATWQLIGLLLVTAILFATLSLLFGWMLQRILLSGLRLFGDTARDDRANDAMRCSEASDRTPVAIRAAPGSGR